MRNDCSATQIGLTRWRLKREATGQFPLTKGCGEHDINRLHPHIRGACFCLFVSGQDSDFNAFVGLDHVERVERSARTTPDVPGDPQRCWIDNDIEIPVDWIDRPLRST